jgi:peptidoglycan L-alanyl-D-glutamate endopeptidase CwlK
MAKIDERSEKNIKTLNPKVQPLARRLIEEATAQGIHVKVICGIRTYDEQNALYAQGRTKAGPIVTKAKGGYSNHNFATAFDIGIFSADGKKYIDESSDYKRCGQIGESLGLEWGGNWAFQDEPHFQYNEGRSMAQLRAALEEKGDALA